jgi:hypothetical protein
MKSATVFLFGSGWSTLWHAIHYLLLLPIWGFYAYCRDFKLGAGPQGGEAIFLFMFLYGIAVVGISVINAIVVVSKGNLVWWRRFLLWPGALLVFPGVAMFIGFAMLDAATDPDFTSAGKLRIAIALPMLILIYYSLNFIALAKSRTKH